MEDTELDNQAQTDQGEDQGGGQDSQQMREIKEALENTQAQIKRALEMMDDKDVDQAALMASLKSLNQVSAGKTDISTGDSRIIEGVFDGQKMVAADGAEYNIPANYASKSKLVEGDMLKLTISGDGSFIYKQIGPIERHQQVARLAKDDITGQWYAVDGGNRWKLLTASVTYFHGHPGDEVVILLPKEGKSSWAAVENIIKGRFENVEEDVE